MGHPRHCEGVLVQGAGLHRAVDQLVEITGSPLVRPAAGQGHKALPTLRQRQAELMGRPALPLHRQGHGGQGQEAVLIAELAGAHRELGGLDPVGHHHRLQGWELQLPARHPRAAGQQLAFALVHRQAFQLAHVIANQVGARRPGGQGQAQVGALGLQGQPRLHQVAGGLAQIQMQMEHRLQTLSGPGRPPCREQSNNRPAAGPAGRRSSG